MSVELFEMPDQPQKPEAKKWTEREVLDRLHARYSRDRGMGPRYIGAEHVRSHPTWAARIADYVAVDTWQGFALHGHEVKVSRSDWLRELADPGKCEAFRPYMNHWWLVVSDAGIVKDDLPDGWGLMVLRKGSLVAVKAAPSRPAEQMPAPMVAALLRATSKTAILHCRLGATRNDR